MRPKGSTLTQEVNIQARCVVRVALSGEKPTRQHPAIKTTSAHAQKLQNGHERQFSTTTTLTASHYVGNYDNKFKM